MRRYVLFAMIFAALGLGAWVAGRIGARSWEKLVASRVMHGLTTLEIDWCEVEVDGLVLTLKGRAPDEPTRTMALQTAAGVAPGLDVLDRIQLRPSPPPPRPPLAFELLRDSEGVTLTGNLAGAAMRDRLVEGLGPDMVLHDLASTEARRPRPGWGAELEIAVRAARALPSARVVVTQGSVHVSGVAADPAARDALATELRLAAGERVELVTELRVPKRVLVPFRFEMTRLPGEAMPRIGACAARDEAERAELETLIGGIAPSPGGGRCASGLGGPEGDWTGAVEASVAALQTLPAGRVQLDGRRVTLTGYPPVEEAAFTAAMTMLATELPDGFELGGRIETPPEDPELKGRLTYWLTAERDAEGAVALAGVAPGTAVRDAIMAYAAALYGAGAVSGEVKVSDVPPPRGWHRAALGAVTALGVLDRGSLEISGAAVEIAGLTDRPETAARAHAILVENADAFRIGSRIEVDLAAALAAMELPAEPCAARLTAILQAEPILFDPGSASIMKASRPTVPELADVLARCPEARFELAGYTDSQGADDMNQRLSRARAEALLDALVATGISPGRLAARGYGEADPVADNGTPEGRALNRRIEFHPMVEEPEPEAEVEPEALPEGEPGAEPAGDGG